MIARRLFTLGATALALAACSTRAFDIGQNDAAAPSPAAVVDASPAVSQYGCPAFIDATLRALRGDTCTGACDAPLGPPYALATQTELVAASAGQWLYCNPTSLGPRDAIGLELAPGCRIFFLRRDDTGAPARGTEASYQASFDVYDLTLPDAPRRIDVDLDPTTKLTFDVRAWACPNRLELTNVATGERIELGTDGFGDAGRPDSIH